MSMYCFQCQETAGNHACTVNGVCGKKSDVANLQDLLIYSLKGIAIFRSAADLKTRKENAETCGEVDKFIVESLFSTITNANFDRNYFINRIKEAIEIRDAGKEKVAKLGVAVKFADHDAANFTVTDEDIDAKAASVRVMLT